MSSENRTSVPNSLNEHWMPFTSNKDFKANPRLITEAKGVYLKTHHGKTQIDASSGLFCNPLGHGRKEITEAVTKQLETGGLRGGLKGDVADSYHATIRTYDFANRRFVFRKMRSVRSPKGSTGRPATLQQSASKLKA